MKYLMVLVFFPQEWLQPSEDQDQAVEMVCAVQSE